MTKLEAANVLRHNLVVWEMFAPATDIAEAGKLAIACLEETYEFIPEAAEVVENIRPCSACSKATSFERHTEDLPEEGEVCSSCGEWFCNDCVVYPNESPVCFICNERDQRVAREAADGKIRQEDTK